MNRNQFITLLVVAAVIGGIGLFLYKRNADSYQGASKAGQPLLGEFNINDVAHIAIRKDDREANIVKQDNVWTVRERGQYPANFEQISEFVRKLDDLKVVQTLQVGPSQLGRLELAAPGQANSATVVEFKDAAGKILASLRVGAKHMKKSDRPSPFGDDGGFPNGRYVMAGNEGAVSVVLDPLSQADPKPEQWLNRDFFKVEKPKSIAVKAPEATNSFKIFRENETAEWQLVDATPEEKLDNGKASGLASALSYPSFNDVVVGKSAEETGLDKPTTVTIETLEGFTYTLQVGGKGPDETLHTTVAVTADIPKERKPGADEKPEDREKLDKEFKEKNDKLAEKLQKEQALSKWTYLVPRWTLESLLKSRSELMAEKKEDDTAAADEEKDDENDPVLSAEPGESKTPANGDGAELP